jgi:hypothetical protein
MFMTYQLVLATDELNMVNRALRGELKPDEVDAAKELAHTIADARVKQGKHHAAEMAKLEANLKKA